MEGLLDFTVISNNATADKKSLWLVSILLGIIICKIVYTLTGIVSNSCFQAYTKLSPAKKVEWDNRGFSTFHALVVAVVSLYLLLISDLFSENSHQELIINRNSTLSDGILGFSLGYFLADLSMIIWKFPALGGIDLALLSGQVQLYIMMVLFTEVTTPFVNLRWYLDVAGKKNSSLYVANGVVLFIGWLIARIILFIYFFTHMALHFNEVKVVFPLGFYCLISIPPILSAMNIVWFWKIARGMIKTLSKARKSRVA
ncbi:hypothetical protein ACFE04_012281 [Oxalis oulophora]